MINAQSISLEGMKLTTKMVCEEAFRRNWKVELFSKHSSHIKLTPPGKKSITVFSAVPPTMPYVVAKASDDKFITQLILADAGLPVLQSNLVEKNDTPSADSLKLHEHPLVVKPLDASHGNGVSVNIQSKEALSEALDMAFSFSSTALVQQYIADAIDIRLVCIDYKFIAGLVRMPASVVGDGEHAIHELISQENHKPYRGYDYKERLNVIDITSASKYMGDEIDTVLAKGVRVPVVGTANVGTGGETHDITDDVPEWLIRMAEQASKTMGLPVCGVDFLIRNYPNKGSSREELQPVIIEINKSPALFIHETPTHGSPRPVIAAYVDYLSRL